MRRILVCVGIMLMLSLMFGCAGQEAESSDEQKELISGKAEMVSYVSAKMIARQRKVTGQKPKAVREPVVAGSFYPSDTQELSAMIDRFLESAPTHEKEHVRAIIVPHAGYVYSGPTAGFAYSRIRGQDIDKVIIIGASHHHAFIGASIPNATHYRTPLGDVAISPVAQRLIADNSFIRTVPQAHAQEHSVEVQLPFLQMALDDFEIVPIIPGSIDPVMLADAISPHIDEKTLVIASSDLSHYHPYKTAQELDEACADAIGRGSLSEAARCEACGRTAILTVMLLAERLGLRHELLDLRNSGDTAGAKDRVVGYMASAFIDDEAGQGQLDDDDAGMSDGSYISSDEDLGDEEQVILLGIARQTLEAYLKEGVAPQPHADALPGALSDVKGCFVTLNKGGQLRGCIGHILAQEPLYQCVMENAINAAVNDRRFMPVQYLELSDIKIEISILSVPRRLEFSTPDDLLAKLRPNTDGVVIRHGMNQAVYLPQVWEQLPKPEDFLSNLCAKAGLEALCWKKDGLEVYVYQADVFSER